MSLLTHPYECIKHLDSEINGVKIIKKVIETSFSSSHLQLLQLIKAFKPDAIILFGQAGGAKGIRVERVAINLQDASIADNQGYMPKDKQVIANASPAYFSTLPIKEIVLKLQDEGIPSNVSNSAGTFVCNHLFFSHASFF